MKISTDHIHQRFSELALELNKRKNSKGSWTGRLSSSALGVAVAIAALHFEDAKKNSVVIQKGLVWLHQNINDDGSFGDTPESPGNVSTSLLVYAALNLNKDQNELVGDAQSKLAGYLAQNTIDIQSPQVAKIILAHYKKDYTFSVPILAMCGLCNVPGKDAFAHIPQLPFELSLLPRSFYRLLNLNVVSYAIPALVAVGIVVYKKKDSNLFWRIIRKYSIGKAMKILHKMLPESGGYLEAIPLTAFVCLSLLNSGFGDTEVVQKGMDFLRSTQRDDGSWPIDVDLSTWVTTLSVKAAGNSLDDIISSNEKLVIAGHLKGIQNKVVHPFNGTKPGGWGWTDFSGSVPDGDDTPGVILSLLKLQDKQDCKEEVLAGCRWLTELQNSDGGFPTFSKGWGKLPFDQSCSDLTGHCLLAISKVLEVYDGELISKDYNQLNKSFKKAFDYLKSKQSESGYWLPLWFGNQYTVDHTNPVYGTAKVLTYLKNAIHHNYLPSSMKMEIDELIKMGESYLLSVQNPDGSWGGDKGIQGSMEETALSVSALSGIKHKINCENGLLWLDGQYRKTGLFSSPIGLYFASLWYDEEMYPITAYIEALERMKEVY